MLVNSKNYRTIWMEGSKVLMINQLLLPHRFEVLASNSHKETADAIKTMAVRGAGAIGAAGAYGVAQAALEAEQHNFSEYLENAVNLLKNTRPTAQNLFTGISYVYDPIKNIINNKYINELKKIAIQKANEYADYDAESCRRIGEFGNVLIKDNFTIQTHCNAGWLAFVDWGSALSPIYSAHRQGKKVFVFVDETRPRNQGSSLTAWELANEKVPHAIIADNAAGHYMNEGATNIVIVGADRIAANGDVANKIGTYEKAVLAKENGIPFYVAAPTTTFDLNCESGSKIPIEERSHDEVLYIHGMDENNELRKIRIAPKESAARNPAFDVTPAKYITGIITEKGIVKANKDGIKRLLESNYKQA